MFFKRHERQSIDALMRRIDKLEMQRVELYDMMQIDVCKPGSVAPYTEISVIEVVRRLVDAAGLELKYEEGTPRRVEIVKKPRKR